MLSVADKKTTGVIPVARMRTACTIDRLTEQPIFIYESGGYGPSCSDEPVSGEESRTN